MDPIEEIIIALLLAGPDDLEAARKYLRWMKVRRQVNNRFYFSAHWVQGRPAASLAVRAHWV